MAIISGVFGLAAFACLIVFLVMRPTDPRLALFVLRSHDVGTILQSLCMIPLALALGSSRIMVAAAVAFLSLIFVLVLLSFAKVVADVLYMIPQGAVGAWLIIVCRNIANGLPTRLRWLGTAAGVGLVLICIFPIGYGLFVDSSIFYGPISDDDPTPPGTERANEIVHIALGIGTLIGCSTYPIWSTLAGRWLLLRGGR